MNSRARVKAALKFGKPDRIPRDMWVQPWANLHYPEVVREIQRQYPSDLVIPSVEVYKKSSRVKGDPYVAGEYVDEWGCVFTNLQAGIIGEVRTPLVTNIDQWDSVTPPYDTLPDDPERARNVVNRSCAETDKFVLANCLPRPWERYQFLRGTENSMMDIMISPEGSGNLIKKIHDFYMKELEFWVTTDIDGIFIMDDWGSQTQILIPPQMWRNIFKPLYKDYCEIAHSHGKFVFMHSDGNILEIYEELIEVGVDALNSQIFCMDMKELQKKAKGKITFWGEIDRQHVLPSEDSQEGRDAVRQVAEYLYDPSGGIIAQFEFGPGANPDTAKAIFEEWEKI